jgi:hypothetical protein
LNDIARSTKISVTVLNAIEESEPARLPARIYTRSFVKSYAREVGLDPEETANRYLAFMSPAPAPRLAAHVPTHGAPRLHHGEINVGAEDNAGSLEQFQRGRFGGLLLMASVVGFVAYLAFFNFTGSTTRVASPGGSSLASATAVAADASPEVPASVADAPLASLEVVLSPDGPCWLSAAADGSRVFAELLQAGDHRRIEVRDELVLRVGDPGACAFSINGEAGRPLGPAGAPVNVRITKDNYRAFLGS